MKPSPSSSCISKILRHILCFSTTSSSSFSRPFDVIKEEKETSSLISGATSNPGLVARLMGLSTLPLRIEPIDGSPSISSCDSVKKSRSPQVRRRKIVNLAYKELEDENFFILSFEHESSVERKKLLGKKKKKSKSIRKRENLYEKNKENGGEVNMVCSKGDLDLHVENRSNVLRPLTNYSCGESARKKKGNGDCKLRAISSEIEVYSENSSPNSVLEFVEFPNDQDSACSGDISRLSNSKMRRTLSEELDNCGNPKMKIKSTNDGFGEQEKLVTNKDQNYAEKWEEIGKLAAMEIVKLSWLQNGISKDDHTVKEIGNDLASEILDQLLDELLVSIP